MLLDQSKPSFDLDLKPRFVDGYAGFRVRTGKANHVGPAKRPYSQRMSYWMRKKIEATLLAGGMTNHAIAKQFGVSQGQVNYTSRRMYLRQLERQS